MQHLPYFLPVARRRRASRDRPARAPGRPYFLFVGRLVRLKGAQTLIERVPPGSTAPTCCRRRRRYGDELRRQAEGLEHVRFLGRVHPDDLRGALPRGAVATLVPSLVYETFGFITLESLAQRTPVIVTRPGRRRRAVEDSGGGFTYRTDDELVAAMERCGRSRRSGTSSASAAMPRSSSAGPRSPT